MIRIQMLLVALLFTKSLMFRNISTQQCGIDTYSIYQQMLKGHTYETFNARPGSLDCRYACNSDVRCQSYNYVIFEDICELNNRTKEARPEDFVKDKDRYYMTKALRRVPLGSIPELPADSCKEIKASEGGLAVSGNYWLDVTRSGNSLLARCDMQTEIADYCITHKCSSTETCVNNPAGYTCVCKPGWTGNQCEIAAVACFSVTILEATNSYEVDASHSSWPADGFCRILRKEEINAGDPYTMSVELLNVIGNSVVNYGHPGMFYNAIDENNFDFVFFRPHYPATCYRRGYVLNGNHVFVKDGSCPNGNPSGGVWFTVSVDVSSDKSVSIVLENVLVTSLTAHFPTKGRGGVLVANGFANIIQFRKFSVIGTN
ncbi:uncharacterized protein LOC144662732 [Oculina patagonica]